MACKCILKAVGMTKVDTIVKTALNGELAINIIKDEIKTLNFSRYNLIFMDQNMPVLDGCSAALEIRELIYQQGLVQPIIIGVSGQVERQYVVKGFESGMNYMLSKPINLDLVKSIL